MENINKNSISRDYKICNFKKSPNCLIIATKDQFNKGRCCKECLIIKNTEFYHKYQAKYKKKALDNKKRKAIRILMEDNNIEV
jgi:hypothetical protein